MKKDKILINIFNFLNGISYQETLKVFYISRFNHILPQNEIYKLPIWYDGNIITPEYADFEKKYINFFGNLHCRFSNEIITLECHFEDLDELINLKANLFKKDKFNDCQEFIEFIKFNLRKMSFMKQNIIVFENEYFFYINDHLELIGFTCLDNIDSFILNEIEANFLHIYHMKRL
jgi:hypothetical protein